MSLPPHVPIQPTVLASRFEHIRRRAEWPRRCLVQSLATKPEGEGLGGFSLAPFLTLLTSGRAKSLSSEGPPTDLHAGDVLVVRSQSWVWLDYGRDCGYLRLTFEHNRLVAGRRLPQRRGGHLELFVVPEPPSRFVEFLLERLQSPDGTTIDRASLLRLLLDEVTTLLRRIKHPVSTGAEARFELVEQYLRDHLDRPLDRATCAQAFGISPTHLSRLFARHAHCGFQKRLETLRIEQAKALLRSTSMSVSDVATSCGFGSDSYFIRIFRKGTGQSPGTWRSTETGRSQTVG